MRKIFFLLFAITVTNTIWAQSPLPKTKNDITNLPNDHFMIQLSSDRWLGAPDSIDSHRKGFSRGANIYLMVNKPFKNNSNFSAAFGIGVGTSNIFLDKMDADIIGVTRVLKFNSLDTLERFKKYKMSTSFLEIPIELRFYSNPKNPNKSFKVAVGVKVGTLLNAHVKGKTLQNAAGATIVDYTQKQASRSYFNTTRLAATVRIGYANFSAFGSCNITSIFKDNVAANMSLLQFGLSFSGL